MNLSNHFNLHLPAVCTWVCCCYHVVIVCVCAHDTDKSTCGDRKNGCTVTPSVHRLASLMIRRLRCGVCDLGTELAPFVCFKVRD